MLTNDELKKKIAQIIAEYCCPLGKTHKQLYGDDRMCYSKMNFAECNPITECTDALIAAGIGDVKEAEAEANRYEMLYKLQNRDMALAERRAHDAEHRAKVLGRTLAIMKGKGLISGVVDDYIVQAEKELAEEGKDENN